MEPDLVNLNPDQGQPAQQELVNLNDTNTQTPPLSAPLVDDRAQKYSFAAGNNLGMDYKAIYDSIQQGQEDVLRGQAAANLNARRVKTAAEQVSKVVAEKGKLSLQDYDFIQQTALKSSNPESVFEVAYGREYQKYVDLLPDLQPKSIMADVSNQTPDTIDWAKEIGAEAIAKGDYALKKLEDMHLAHDGQSWVGWTADRAKELVPLYQNIQETGWMKDVSRVGLLGNNLEEETRQILKLPMDQFTKKVDEIAAYYMKNNPGLGLHWLAALSGMSTDDIAMSNLTTLFDVSMLKPGLGVSAARYIRNAREVGKVTKEMTQAVNEVKKAENPSLAKSVVLDAAGATDEAAVQKVVGTKAEEFKGKPTEEKRVLDTMFNFLRMDKELFKRNAVKDGEEAAQIRTTLAAKNAEKERILDTVRGSLTTEELDKLEAERSAALDLRARVDNEVHPTAIWRSKDTDFPVEVLPEKPQPGPNGRLYQKVSYKGQESHVPLDELDMGAHGKIAKDYAAAGERIKEIDKLMAQDATKTMHPNVAERLNKLNDEIYALTSILGESKPNRLSKNRIAKMEAGWNSLISNLSEAVQNVLKVQRIPAIQAAEAVIRSVKDMAREHFPGIRNAVMEISDLVYNKTTNTYTVQLKVGNPHGELWFNKQMAETFFKNKGLEHAVTIEPQGNGFFGRISYNLPETANVIRDALIEAKGASASPPDRWMMNALFGKYRTPDEVLSLEQRINRKTAIYAQSVYLKVAKEAAKDIRKLASWNVPGTKKALEYKEWERIIKFAKDDVHPITEQVGYFKKTTTELDDIWQRTFGHLPSDRQMAAYFAHTRMLEMDRIFREMALYRNISRLGGHTFQVWQPVGTSKKQILSDWFHGIRMNELPQGLDDTIVILGDQLEKQRVISVNKLHSSKKLFNELSESVKRGEYNVIRIYDPHSRPLRTYGQGFATDYPSFTNVIQDQPVRYVLSKNINQKPLTFGELVPRREGGHYEYDYKYFIKQAKVFKQRLDTGKFSHIYEGDATIAPVEIRAMGHDVAEKMDRYRQLLKDGKEAEAKVWARANLPFDEKELRGWFRKTKIDGIVNPARLSLTERIQVVPRNAKIGDMGDELQKQYAGTFRDGTRSGSDARQYAVDFTGQRDSYDLMAINNKGTAQNPLYELVSPEMIDPMPSINRSISNIVKSSFLDDYKIFSVEHWIQEASKYLKPEINDLRSAPFSYFHNANDYFRKDAPAEEIRRLKAQHFQINQLLGITNETDSVLQRASQALYDSVYQASPYSLKKTMLIPAWSLSKASDVPSLIRSLVFHYKLGLFNVVQLATQAQTFTAIFGIAGPTRAAQGVTGALLYGWSRINRNPAFLAELDKYASKLGYRPGEFLEALKNLERTGFAHIQSTYALQDHHVMPKYIKYAGGQVLDWGAMFFRGGEKAVRLGAFFTAHQEYRAAHPFGRITERELGLILERADTLTVNMSHASSSALHSGSLSVTSQFYAYQIRSFELFMGKRLTKIEKARLLGTYAALYGIPGSLGLTGLPAADYIRSYAIDNGYNVGENFGTSLVMEGMPSMLGALVTGGGDFRKGTFYNFNEQYGMQGMELIREAMRSDATVAKILGGAAWSTISGTWEQSDGFRTMMGKLLRGEPNAFSPKIEDFVDLFKEISAVNNTWRLLMAYNTGKLFSKKEAYLGDVSMQNAIWQYFTGLKEQDVSDLQIVAWAMKSQKEFQQYAEQKFVEEFRRGLREADVKNYSQADKYFTRAWTYLDISDYPQEDRPKALAMAVKDNENLVDRLSDNYFLHHVPESKKDVRLQSLIKRNELKDVKK